MDISNDLTNGAKLIPTRAIIIYEDEEKPEANPNFGTPRPSTNCLATMHDIFTLKGKPPMIGEGRCVDHKAIADFAQSLSKTTRTGQFLPDNVLAISLTRMMWWHPSCVRRLWFKSDNPELNALNKRMARHPALLFDVSDASLNVYALAQDKRPTPATQLYRAPYLNVGDSGGVQLCGCKTPPRGDMSVRNIPHWEKAFYDSSFTHGGNVRASCTYKGGMIALWEAMTATPAPEVFPGRCLIAKQTLAKLINEQEPEEDHDDEPEDDDNDEDQDDE